MTMLGRFKCSGIENSRLTQWQLLSDRIFPTGNIPVRQRFRIAPLLVARRRGGAGRSPAAAIPRELPEAIGIGLDSLGKVIDEPDCLRASHSRLRIRQRS